MSYFEHYYNPEGEKTLRRYSRPVDLRRFDPLGWMTAEDDGWASPQYLCTVGHRDLLPMRLVRRLSRVDDRLYAAGRLGLVG